MAVPVARLKIGAVIILQRGAAWLPVVIRKLHIINQPPVRLVYVA
jgi:hypothetical protein